MIEIKDITVRYPGQDNSNPALSNFGITLDSGEYLAVLGANGSGKSTLIKAICGLIEHESGNISIDGIDVRPGKFGDNLFGKVGVVFQEPTGQFLMPTVNAEIEMVLQNLGLSYKDQQTRLDKIVDSFSLKNLLYKRPENLSGGQMQLVNLACAIAADPGVLLLDEPVTFLDPSYRRIVLDLISDLHRRSVSILHVTQYPDIALRAEKVALIHDGQLAASGEPENILSNEESLRKYGLTIPKRIFLKNTCGIDLDQYKSGEATEKTAGVFADDRKSGNQKVLSADNLRFNYAASEFEIDIERLEFSEGKVTAVVGPAGCGKSTLAFLLAGLLKPVSGKIALRGNPIDRITTAQLRAKVAICWQVPDTVFLGPCVRDDLESFADRLGVDKSLVKKALTLARLSDLENRTVDSLSGGEKRRLSLAGTLLVDPEVVLMDEPGAFLDPLSQLELAVTIRGLSQRGKTIIVISHDLHFLSLISDEVTGIKAGKLLFQIDSLAFFNDPAYLKMLGFPSEPLINLRQSLVKNGAILDKPSLEPKYLASFCGK